MSKANYMYSPVTWHVVVIFACCMAISWLASEATDYEKHSTKTSHITDGLHNPVFNHKALLSAYKREELAELPHHVRIRRLHNLAKSHDSNKNDVIEAQELKEWIIESYRIMDREEARNKLEKEDMNGDGKVSFWEIVHKHYGYSEDDVAEMQKNTNEENADMLQLIMNNKYKFAAADLNHDGLLDHLEYFAYFQPYYFPHMHKSVMERALRDLDVDDNGSVSLEEFVRGKLDEEVRKYEMAKFDTLDKDKDGKLTSGELRPWALPFDDDVAADQADNLISLCDKDKDGRLSVAEIVSKEDEFLGSIVTAYGRNLHFVKDEL